MISANWKMERVMYAIAEMEGWIPLKSEGRTEGSRSYRHHNPGNLRASPFECDNIDNFSVFKNDMIGFMALQWDLTQKCKGLTKTKLGPESTLRELFEVYAPAEDGNNPLTYYEGVIKLTGLDGNTRLKDLL